MRLSIPIPNAEHRHKRVRVRFLVPAYDQSLSIRDEVSLVGGVGAHSKASCRTCGLAGCIECACVDFRVPVARVVPGYGVPVGQDAQAGFVRAECGRGVTDIDERWGGGPAGSESRDGREDGGTGNEGVLIARRHGDAFARGRGAGARAHRPAARQILFGSRRRLAEWGTARW